MSRRVAMYVRDTGNLMTSAYSIEKSGNEYVVKVDDQSVMIVKNRRKAVRLVTAAAGMLGQGAPERRALDRERAGITPSDDD